LQALCEFAAATTLAQRTIKQIEKLVAEKQVR
jgi:hypothetical protein